VSKRSSKKGEEDVKPNEKKKKGKAVLKG